VLFFVVQELEHTYWYRMFAISVYDPKTNGVAAMLVALLKRANEKSFVYDHQHGCDDITCKPRIVNSLKQSWLTCIE